MRLALVLKPVGLTLALSCAVLRPAVAEEQIFDAPGQSEPYPMKAWMVGAGLVAVGLAMPFDYNVRSQIQTHSRLREEEVAEIGNRWGETGGVVVALGVLGAGKLFNQNEVFISGSLMAQSALSAGLSARLIKIASGRLRPEQNSDADEWGLNGSSFPSGHTSQAFALSTAFAEGVPNPSWQRRTLAYSLAVSTAYARVYDDKHWLSDTVAGALVGSAAALSVIHLNRAHKNWYVIFEADAQNNPQLGVTINF